MAYDEYGIDEVKGVEGIFTHRDHPNKIFNKGGFLKEWADKYLDNVKTIIDIGALEGGDTLRFSYWYPQATIHSIEASISNFNIMNEKLSTIKNIKTHNVIISDVSKLSHNFYEQTYIDNNGVKMVVGSIFDRIPISVLKSGGSISLQSQTFDDFCYNNNITEVDIAHIDVEGATYNVIQGMNKILPKLIYTEKDNKHLYKDKITGGETELQKLLQEKNYQLIFDLGNDYLFKLM